MRVKLEWKKDKVNKTWRARYGDIQIEIDVTLGAWVVWVNVKGVKQPINVACSFRLDSAKRSAERFIGNMVKAAEMGK
jgi:hypothetical protein